MQQNNQQLTVYELYIYYIYKKKIFMYIPNVYNNLEDKAI